MTKPTKWHERPAKTQISLDIRPVWSQSSLCAQWVAKDPSFLHVDSEDSEQTERMPRLLWVFAGRTCHSVGFVTRQLKYVLTTTFLLKLVPPGVTVYICSSRLRSPVKLSVYNLVKLGSDERLTPTVLRLWFWCYSYFVLLCGFYYGEFYVGSCLVLRSRVFFSGKFSPV